MCAVSLYKAREWRREERLGGGRGRETEGDIRGPEKERNRSHIRNISHIRNTARKPKRIKIHVHVDINKGMNKQ